MNSWMGFCLYVAAGVFIQDQRSGTKNPQSMTNLDFLVTAMKAIGGRHHITQHFTAQVELDIESSGIKALLRNNGNMPEAWGGHRPLHGILPETEIDVPTGFAGVCTYILNGKTTSLPVNPAPGVGIYLRESRQPPGIEAMSDAGSY